MTTNDPSTPSYGQQPPYGQQQPPYLPPPQQGQYGQQPPYFPPQQPPSGPSQWQQPGGQPPRPPRKSHRARNIILGILGAVVLIIIIASVASNGNGNTPSASSTSQPPAAGNSASTSTSSPAPAAAALSSTGADGDFKFTVTSWSCGQAASDAVYGNAAGFASQPAGTTECVAMLSVTNVHNGAQQFFATNQYAINLRGQKLSADDNQLYAGGALGQEIVQVNPGQTISAGVAYAVPNGETIAKLELHDSAFSGGVDLKP